MSITLNEIMSQNEALKKTIRLVSEMKPVITSEFKNKTPARLAFIGCGSSYELACGLRNVAAVKTNIPSIALAAGDVWLNASDYITAFQDAWVICITRSGRTSELLNACEAIDTLNVGAKYVSLICANDTPLEKISTLTLAMPWAFDESVCQTRSVTNLFAAGAMLLDVLTESGTYFDEYKAFANIGNDTLEKANSLAKSVAEWDWCRCVVLADGPVDGLGAECGLAFKEISQQEGYFHHVLDVRHGPMVLIRQNTLVIAWLPNAYGMNSRYSDLFADIVKNGGKLIVVAELPQEISGATVLPIGSVVGKTAGATAMAMLCQLIAYYKSSVVGCNPDQPDGLDAWIEIK